MSQKSRPVFWIALAWTGLIFAATSIPLPSNSLPGEGGNFLHIPIDKLVHGGLFAGFAFFWSLALSEVRAWPVVVGLAGLAMGGLTEAVQAIPVLKRVADWEDWFADSIGVGIGLGAAWAAIKVWRVIAGGGASREGIPFGTGVAEAELARKS